MVKKIANWPLHPFLFAAFMVLSIASTDPSLVFFLEGWRSLVILPLSAGLVMLGLHAWLKDWARTGFLASMLLFLIFIYGHLRRSFSAYSIGGVSLGSDTLLFPLWVLLIGFLSSPWLWRRIRQPHLITQTMNLMAVAGLLFPVFTTARIGFQLLNDPLTGWQPTPIPLPALSSVQKPDIYYIILDGYGRQDILSSLYGHDNSAFLSDLENMGFYVADQSYSNYYRTSASLASSLNFTYLDELSQAGQDTSNWMPMRYLIANSQVRQVLKEQGYTFVSFSTAFVYTDISGADVYLSPNRIHLNSFEHLLVGVSALELLARAGWLDVPVFTYDSHRQRVLYAFENLSSLPTRPGLPPGPKFVFAHVIVPHPPFVFDRHGSPIEPQRPFAMSDAADFEGPTTEYLLGYRDQVTYTNQLLLETIASIQSQSAVPPVIIVQGDHGPGAYFVWGSIEESCLQERLAILNAYYLPGAAPDSLYPSISPVNTFRVVLNTYFGAGLPMLEDLSFSSRNDQFYRFEDITDLSRQPCTNVLPPP